MGELISIVYAPNGAMPVTDGFTRSQISETKLIAGYGIEGDRKGGSKKRQINIMSSETVQQLGSEGFLTKPGQLGEQLIVSGLVIDSLAAGTRIQIGGHAIIEIIEPRTGCSKFEKYQSRPISETAGRLGMMAKVVEDGSIQIGDKVELAASSLDNDPELTFAY